MSGDLSVGDERVDEFEVDDRLTTDVGGTLKTRVLSTPGMIAMMERNAAMLAFPKLPNGQASVGFEVCVRHVAGALHGARCTVRATPRKVVEDRTLRFDVEARGRAGHRRGHPRAPSGGRRLSPAAPA